MVIHKYDDKSGSLYAHLVDGFLPEKSKLVKTAEIVSQETVGCTGMGKPYSWDNWDCDGVFQYIAYNTRGKFHKETCRGRDGNSWSEGWLLNSEKWGPEYKLKSQEEDVSMRRLFITLYDGCKRGEDCMQNIVEKSGFQVIPEDKYHDFNAFQESVEKFLDDIALPFQAPCLIAQERMASRGYEFLGFGR